MKTINAKNEVNNSINFILELFAPPEWSSDRVHRRMIFSGCHFDKFIWTSKCPLYQSSLIVLYHIFQLHPIVNHGVTTQLQHT